MGRTLARCCCMRAKLLPSTRPGTKPGSGRQTTGAEKEADCRKEEGEEV